VFFLSSSNLKSENNTVHLRAGHDYLRISSREGEPQACHGSSLIRAKVIYGTLLSSISITIHRSEILTFWDWHGYYEIWKGRRFAVQHFCTLEGNLKRKDTNRFRCLGKELVQHERRGKQYECVIIGWRIVFKKSCTDKKFWKISKKPKMQSRIYIYIYMCVCVCVCVCVMKD
jgi:hypothetical protein